MKKSQPQNTQDIAPRKPIGPEGLPKKVWNRLSDRNKLPGCLWFLPKRHIELDADEWRRQHDEVSISLRRTMITLLGYSFFCMLTLAAPDVSLIARDAKIKVPFAGTEVSYQAFLIIGPLTMFGLAIYLHILLGHWLSLGKHKDTFPMPYIFNMENKTAKRLATFIFYWIPCLVLAFFSWKALPRPFEAFLLIIQTAIFFTCMVVLRIRRFPDDHHRFRFNALYLFGWLLGVCLLLMAQFGFYQRNLDLFRADLSKKDLRNTYLFNANLREADLNEANLQEADLREANLQKANLQEADLWRANLQKAKLGGVSFREAKAWEINLMEANFGRTDLRIDRVLKADLQGANLQKASLQEANLQEADLWRANLQEADLRRANLQKASLRRSNLQEADLRGASLQGANLQEADLWRANLRETKELSVEQLCKASILYEAKLDQKLEAQIKQECPDLLKEPQKNVPDEKK